jgi:hypothetical protein
MLVLYIPFTYISVLVEYITLNRFTIYGELQYPEYEHHLFHAIDNKSCQYIVFIFVYIPMIPVLLLPILSILILLLIKPSAFTVG